MSKSWNWMRIAGLVLHVLIGGLMIFASLGKVTGTPPSPRSLVLAKTGLDEQLRLIGFGELITGVLLIVPWTASIGVLLASAFWGPHLHAHGNDTSCISVGLLAGDLGRRYLRLPEMFSSFWRSFNAAPPSS